MRWFSYGIVVVVLIGWVAVWGPDLWDRPAVASVGDEIDSYQQVAVYYNGRIGHTAGRHLGKDGYNFGLKWQASEFVKRFYYEAYGHRMPDTYGYPKDYFNPALADGAFNVQRGLFQYRLPGESHPRPGDLLVWGPGEGRKRGHVAIVTKSPPEAIEYIQQNPGRKVPPRAWIAVVREDRKWHLDDAEVVGFLRKG